MSFLPPPLDSLYVLIAVIIGVGLLLFAVKHNRAALKRLDAARKEKAKTIRDAKIAAKNKS
jgi:Na+/H+ antiporter NhaB